MGLCNAMQQVEMHIGLLTVNIKLKKLLTQQQKKKNINTFSICLLALISAKFAASNLTYTTIRTQICKRYVKKRKKKKKSMYMDCILIW